MPAHTLDHPLSDNEDVRGIEAEMLSQTLRDMWGAWTRGAPFAEVLDVRRDRKTLSVTYTDQPATIDAAAVPFCIVGFLAGLAHVRRDRFQKTRFVAFTSISNQGPQILLRLAVPQSRGKAVSPSASAASGLSGHPLHKIGPLLAEAIESVQGLAQESIASLKQCTTVQSVASWITSNLLGGPLKLPISRANVLREGARNQPHQLGFIQGESSEEVWLSFENEHRMIWPNRRGGDVLLVDKTPRRSCPQEDDVFFAIDVAPIGAREASPVATSINRIVQSYLGIAGVNEATVLLSTLLAERVQLEQRCWPYELKSDGAENASVQLLPNEPHPKYGEMQRMSGVALYDQCLSDNSFSFQLTQKPGYFASIKDAIEVDLLDVDGENPNLIRLGTSGTHKAIPERGWIRPTDIGTKELLRRKEAMVNAALANRASIRALLSLEDGEAENIATGCAKATGWRLPTSGVYHVVQGPPGTGKTWTATRLIEDLLERHPEARVLVCGKEHLALDHLVSEVDRGVAGNKGATHREGKDETTDIAVEFVKRHLQHTMAIGECKDASVSLNERLTTSGAIATWPLGIHRRESNVVGTTVTSAEMQRAVTDGDVFDFVVVEEAGKCYPSELIGAFCIARTVVLIGDQMQLPPFELREISQNLSSVVQSLNRGGKKFDRLEKQCLDVARIALDLDRDDEIPIELVEDLEPFLQPFKLLHERELLHLTPATTLHGEYRMFQSLSDIVGEVFYGQPFAWAKSEEVELGGLPNQHQKFGRLMLLDAPHCSEQPAWREQRSANGSLHNQKEAELILRLAEKFYNAEKQVRTVVLTPYLGQRDLLRMLFDKANIRIDVETVDGFQGKERDFVILSLVRNNDKTASRRWGFVSDPRRLNVALSRAREALMVVCSMKHLDGSEFDEQEGHLADALYAIQERGAVVQEGAL